MNSTKEIVFVTFDIPKPDYPALSYSVASMMATLKHFGIVSSHYSLNLQQSIGSAESKSKLNEKVEEQIRNAIGYFKKFNFIAIGVSRWSIEHTNAVLKGLDDFKGQVVLGGYEITAMDEDSLFSEFPQADYYVKGYAEKALVKLIKGEYSSDDKILYEELDGDYLVSPYQTGILNLTSRKVYWETKRGCKYNCGFCEWGNANIGVIPINSDILKGDIEMFSKSNVEEINILDGTFNYGSNYIKILEDLIHNTDALITIQARFEALKDDFLDFCKKHKKRLHFEFGLQTIHKTEMKVIGRVNAMKLISSSLESLNNIGVNYEVSIIYAIPGQTVNSFIDTIEYLFENGCTTIRAYPLQVPRNSNLEKNKVDLGIQFEIDDFNVRSVSSSNSFYSENRSDMDRIADKLNNDAPFYKLQLEKTDLKKLVDCQYQYKILPKGISKNMVTVKKIVHDEFISPTISDLTFKYNYWEGTMLLGAVVNFSENDYFNFSIGKKYAEFGGKLWKESNRKPDLVPTKFFCKITVGESGNVYVYRVIEKSLKKE